MSNGFAYIRKHISLIRISSVFPYYGKRLTRRSARNNIYIPIFAEIKIPYVNMMNNIWLEILFQSSSGIFIPLNQCLMSDTVFGNT